jgi:hypothetical protein
MAYIMVDVETDGPIPGDYSMISFGAVVVDRKMDKTFYGELRPISNNYDREALAVSNLTRQETFSFRDPADVMWEFDHWLKAIAATGERLFFISDNNGFDWMFMCWYFWHFVKSNPFGHSSTNLGSLFKGIKKNMFHNFKHLRRTVHSHNPVDDARGNVEALLAMKDQFGLKIDI